MHVVGEMPLEPVPAQSSVKPSHAAANVLPLGGTESFENGQPSFQVNENHGRTLSASVSNLSTSGIATDLTAALLRYCLRAGFGATPENDIFAPVLDPGCPGERKLGRDQRLL